MENSSLQDQQGLQSEGRAVPIAADHSAIPAPVQVTPTSLRCAAAEDLSAERELSPAYDKGLSFQGFCSKAYEHGFSLS